MSFARGFMRWLAPIGGASQDPRVVRDTPTASRFRVEPLEPRLLLSGDPLDVLKGSLELQLLQEPAVAISDTYYGKYNKHPRSKDWRDWPFLCGDGAVQAADGYYRILGRIDDVINVAGHRLGTKEIESACLTVPEIAEAAVVPVQDELKGRVPEVYVAL